MKLRKHLRTKKLNSIEQLGVDRVIDLTFGKGEASYHILVELYASGNVILTDHEYTILSLLRSHKFEDDANIAVKSKYPFSNAAGMTIDSITTDTDGVRALM
jgi:predicted ribosome quality control (RQC) complex YloA/Tae2 family protein